MTKDLAEVERRCLELEPELVVERKCRSTGTVVQLWRNFDEFPWATVCADHGGIVGHYTRRDAEGWLSHPEDWCPTCQEDREKNVG